MYKVEYSRDADKNLGRLEPKIRERIVRKINFYASHRDITPFAKSLTGLNRGRFRFRIGDYRAIFSIGKDGQIQILMILAVKHRREVYD